MEWRNVSVMFGFVFLFALITSVSAVDSCNSNTYVSNQSTLIGANNVTITIATDKCFYYGLSANVSFNVTRSDTLVSNITNATYVLNLSVPLAIGAGANNYTLRVLNLGTWTTLAVNGVTTPITNFSWNSGEVKQFIVNYTFASGSVVKFNISSNLSFNPVIYSTSSQVLTTSLRGITYNSTPAASGSIMFLTTATGTDVFSHFPVSAAAAGVSGYTTDSVDGANFTQQGFCQWLYSTTPARFTSANKTANTSGVYCFPINQSGTIVAHTIVRVTANATNTNLTIDYRTDANQINVSSELDPIFDTNIHNVTIQVNGTSGYATTPHNLSISLYYSNNTLFKTLSSNTTLSNATNGNVTFDNIPSDNYTINVSKNGAAYVGASAYLNVTGTAGQGAQALYQLVSNFAGQIVRVVAYNASAGVLSNTNVTINATGFDLDNNPNTLGPSANSFNWTVVNVSIALPQGSSNASNSSIYYANRSGSVTINITSNANTTATSNITSITTIVGAVTRVIVTNSSGSSTLPSIQSGPFGVNANSSLMAVGYDVNNNVNNTATWAVNNASVGYMNQTTGAYATFIGNKTGGTTVNATIGGVTNATSTITVTAAIPTRFVISPTSPVNSSGGTYNVSIEGYDVNNNTNNTGGYNWTFGATTNLTLTGAVTYNLSNSARFLANNTYFSDAVQYVSNSTVSVTSNINTSYVTNVTVGVAVFSAFNGFKLSNPNGTAGNGINVSVTALDTYGNRKGDYVGNTSFYAISDANATKPANYTFNNTNPTNDTGLRTFVINYTTSGAQTYTVMSRDTTSLNTTSSALTVNATTITSYQVTSSTGTPATNTDFNITITAKDAFNNTNGTANSVTLTSNADVQNLFTFDGTGTSKSITLTNGIGTAIVKYLYLGTFTITATDANGKKGTVSVTFQAGTSTGATSGSTTTTSTTATSTPAPTAAPTSIETPSETPEEIIVTGPTETETFDSGDVVGTFGDTATSFDLSYIAPSGGFSGSVEYRLPFSYADYLAGTITISPTPTSVREGSIIATWDDVVLNEGEQFTAKVIVPEKLDPAVLKEFSAPVVVPKKKAETATPSATVAPSATIPAEATAGPNYVIWIIVAVAVIAVAYFAVARKK